MTPWATVSLLELLWTLAALPGLALWSLNAWSAARSLQAIRSIGAANGRLTWAQFSLHLTLVFVVIDIVFVIIGGISMTRLSNPSGSQLSTQVIGAGLLLASAAISLLSYRWRVVDMILIGRSRRDRAKVKE